jgi:integrase/recombinase XerD
MYEEGVLTKNPAEMLSSLKVEQKSPAYLTQKQFNSLVEVVELASPYYKERDLALINIMAKSGLRRAEIISLNVGDIDLEKNRIRVKRKGGNTVNVFIHKELKEDIERYLETIDRNGNEPLFTSRLNRRIDASTIWRTIKNYAHRAGLEDNVTVHSLRHTFATTLLRQGVGIHSIQRLMNHKSIVTTSRYLHLVDEELEDEFNSMSFKQEEQLV